MNRNQENIEGSESPAIGPADRLLTNSKEATRSRSSSPRASNSRTMNRRMADCWSRIPRPKIPPMPKMPTWLRTNALTILSVLGVFLGAVIAMIMRFSREERWTEREIVYVGFVGELFLRMLKCLILPLIVSSLVSAIGSLDLSLSGRIGIRAIVYYMTTTLSAVILGIVLVVTIHPGRGSEDGITRAGTTRHVMSNDILMDLVRNLFPPNLVQACFAQYKTVLHPPMGYEESKNDSLMNTTTEPGNVTKPDLHLWKMSGEWENSTNILGLVVFSITLGITLGKLGPKGKPLLSFFVCLSESMMQITSWVIWTSPVGVLSLVAAKMLEMESWEVMLGQLGMYFLTVMLGLFIHGFIVLFSIFFFVTRKLPFRFVGNMFEALATAFATSSSSATLPVALQCLEEKNGIDPRVTRFVMPIGATINMDGTALYEAVAAIFISQVRNIRLSLGNIAAISITATAASIGAAGIPQAGLVTMVMVLDTVGLTAEDVTLILAIDWFLDRFRTFTNVLGDSLGAGIVHHLSKKELADLPQTVKESNPPPVDLEASADAIDLEKGESNGLTTAKSNVTSTRVDVEYQATSM